MYFKAVIDKIKKSIITQTSALQKVIRYEEYQEVLDEVDLLLKNVLDKMQKLKINSAIKYRVNIALR